jgi:hypothetical protein
MVTTTFGTAAFEAGCTDNSRGMGGLTGRRHRISVSGASGHDLLHHGYEALLVGLAEVGHGLKMSPPCRLLHLAQQRSTRPGQAACLRPAVMASFRAIDKATRLQSLECSRRRRSVEGDVGGQCRLVGGSTVRKRCKKTILQRRDFEGRALFLKQGDVDLVQTPDQVTRPFLERPRAFSLCCGPCCHRIAPGRGRRGATLHEFEAVYATDTGVRKYEVYFVIGRLPKVLASGRGDRPCL